jgi:DNA helicase II / ATP-dependent DNA helicase PcrA
VIFLLDLSTLNEQQKQAVTSPNQYLRVIAGAGSGKTRVLTYRIAHLIQDLGIADRTILAITFTNKAANEMKQRVAKLLNKMELGSHISTFHSFCARFLREEIRLINYPTSFVIIDEEDQYKIINELMTKNNLDKEVFSVKGIIAYISNFKTEAIGVEQAYKYAHGLPGDETKVKIYEDYEKYLTANHYLDFDDLILKTVLILEKFEQTRVKWQHRFSNILVDEFQDTNWIQFRLIQYLASPKTSVLVVGDPDQTIYTWRGADVSIILDFPNMFKGTEDVVLHKNYRSTKTILNCANALIKNNSKRVHKDLDTDNKAGSKNIYYQADSSELEALWVVDRINDLVKNNPQLTYSDFAILYRSNFYSRAFETALNYSKVPYLIFGGIRFFERREVKDVMAYLRLLVRDDDNLAFERIINTPRRGVGDKTLEVLKIRASQNNNPYYVELKTNIETSKNNSLKQFVEIIEQAREKLNTPGCLYYELIDFIVKKTGYLDQLIEANEEERIENINELSGYLNEMQKNNPYLPLIEIIQELSLLSSQDEIKDKNFVSLMTVHTAKGLEFNYVFVVGMSEGIFPSSRALMEGSNAIEEERRLAYVAFTRAKNQLFLTDSLGINFASNSRKNSSQFLHEVGEHVTPYYNFERFHESLKRPQVVKPIERKLKPQITSDQDYRPGDLVVHDVFGEGLIIAISSNVLTITFKNQSYGQKMISKSFGGLHKKGG